MADVHAKHKMSTLQLTIVTVVNMIGSGIIMLPAQLAGVGNISIFSWLLTTVGVVALSYCFAKCGRFSKNKGGMGGYAQYAFGKSGNMMANYTYALAIVIANVAIAVSAVGYFCTFLNVEIGGLATALWIIFFMWITTIPNFWGSKITGRIGSVTIWGVLIPLFGVIILGWFWFSPHIYAEAWNPHHYSFFGALPQCLALTMWAFLGLESACANSDAVENPDKSVPIAVLGGTLFTAAVYIVASAVIGGMIPYQELAVSAAPFGLVYSMMFGGWVGKAVELIMCLACVGSLLTWQFTTGMVFKSCADVGYFFKIFGKVTKRGAPVIGLTILCIIQSLFTLMSINPSLNAEFNVIVDFSVVIDLIPYIFCMSACSVVVKNSLEFKSGKISRSNLIFIGVAAFVANCYTFYAIWSSGSEAVVYGSLVTFTGWVVFGRYISSILTRNQNGASINPQMDVVKNMDNPLDETAIATAKADTPVVEATNTKAETPVVEAAK